MKRQSEKLLRHLSKSILLEETGSPGILKIILLMLNLTVISFVIWAAFVPLNKTVSASGDIFPRSDTARIQHQLGGTVELVNIFEGRKVVEGELLVKLNGEAINSRILQQESRLQTLSRQSRTLKEQLRIKKELLDQGLYSATNYLTMERRTTELTGEINEARQVLNRLMLQKQELDLYAPIAGTIHKMIPLTTGSVIRTGQVLFEIIPEEQSFLAKVRVAPGDIGTVKVGSQALLQFSSYDFSRIGGMQTEIQSISASTYIDENGSPYYQATLLLPFNFLGKVEGQYPILPGMTLVAEIKTGEQSLLEYLILPVRRASESSFKEP